MVNRPQIIGVTGGIGSGKSTVCKILEMNGSPIYYADARSKWILNNETDIQSKVIGLFGNNAYNEHGLNRRFISESVFKNKDLLKKLNAIAHPAVAIDFEKWVNKNQNSNILYKEAALLVETYQHKNLDKLLVVNSPLQLRIDRILARDTNRTKDEVKAIIDKQLPENEKLKYADYIIHNDLTHSLIEQLKNYQLIQ